MSILYLYYCVPSATVTNSRDSSVCRVAAAKVDQVIDIDMYIDSDTDTYTDTYRDR